MTPSDDFDYEQEERDIGAAFRALLPPPPVPATPDELDAAFFAAIRTFPVGSVAPHPPDIASRLVPIARRAVARARRRTFLRRVAVCFLAAVFLVGCAVFSPLWRKLVFRAVSGCVSDEWTVCGDVWTLGDNWAESRSLCHGTMPLEWKGPIDTNVELRLKIRLSKGDDPIHGVRIALTSGMQLNPGVELLVEANRIGVAVGPGDGEWGRWALSGKPGWDVAWIGLPDGSEDIPVRVIWQCGEISVYLRNEVSPFVQTRKCKSYFDPAEFRNPAVLRLFATGVRLSDLAIRLLPNSGMSSIPENSTLVKSSE